MAWVVAAIAPDQVTAEMWIAFLRDEGIAAVIRPSDAVSWLGVSGFGCRVLVEEENLQRAREVIGEDQTD